MDETQAKVAPRRLPSPQSILAVTLLLAIGLGLPILLGAVSGSLFVPRNDDPSYRRVALDLYSSGHLAFNGWSSMTLVGLIFFVQPFLWLSGGSAWAFTAATVVLTGVGIVAGYSLARRVLSVPRATLAMLGVLVFPGFLLNTTSYMTDVPAWAAMTTCLALGVVALDREGRRRWLWLVASLAVGCFGFSIREFSIAAPAAVLFVLVLSPGLGQLRYWIAGFATLAVCVGIYWFVLHVPFERGGLGIHLSVHALGGMRQGLATLALMISPALAVAVGAWWRRWRVVDVLAGLAPGLVLFGPLFLSVVRTHSVAHVVTGNVLGPTGTMTAIAMYGVRPLLYPFPWWQLLNILALVGALAIFAIGGGMVGAYLRATVRRLRAGDRLRAFYPWKASTWTVMATLVAIYGAGLCAWSLVFGFYMFDRYMWPMVLPLFAMLLRPPMETEPDGEAAVPAPAPAQAAGPRRWHTIERWATPVVATLLMITVSGASLVLLLNTDSFDAARWHAGEVAVERGTPANQVDAGFEWVTYYATGLATPNLPANALGGNYDTWWPSFHLCTLVSTTPINKPNVTLLVAEPQAWRLLLFAGPWEPFYIYRVADSGCAQ